MYYIHLFHLSKTKINLFKHEGNRFFEQMNQFGQWINLMPSALLNTHHPFQLLSTPLGPHILLVPQHQVLACVYQPFSNYSLVAIVTGQITYGVILSVPQIQQGNLHPLIHLHPLPLWKIPNIYQSITELPPDSIIINLWTILFYEQPLTALFISSRSKFLGLNLFSSINISVSISKRYAPFQNIIKIS